MKKIKVVTIGGGTGTSVVLSALKKIENLELTAIVSVSDNGGSTGRLRDEFGFLPVGDLRQALAALAKEGENDWIKKVLLYRFEKGSGLEGHNLGNLVLTALQDMSGSTQGALEIASSIFGLKGKILPITIDDSQIEINYVDGSRLVGEKNLDEEKGGIGIKSIKLVPGAKIYQKAKMAIVEADYLIISPGDLYASIMANLVVGGTRKAIKKSKAKIIYMMSLMTKYTQTYGMLASDHLRIIEKGVGRPVDFIFVNSGRIPTDILEAYRRGNDEPIVDDLGSDKRVRRIDLIRPVKVVQNSKDKVIRSYLRHDPLKVKKTLEKILTKKVK